MSLFPVSTTASFVGVGDVTQMDVANHGPSTVYYGVNPAVSSSVNVGSIASGASDRLAAGYWFVTASGSATVDALAVELSGTATTIFEEVAGASGQAEFDTGTLDLSSYREVELRMRGRTDSSEIYDYPLLTFNGDETVGNYHHAAVGSNPVSSAIGGGFFAARWDSQPYFNGTDTGTLTEVGILTGYVAGGDAQAGYTAGWRGVILDPGEAWLPHSGEFYTRFIEAKTIAHAADDNGPEIIATAAFWTPAEATAITRMQLAPGLGTEFVEGTKFTLLGRN